MSLIDRELVKCINRENCVLFVGSGASCDAGYPSWSRLVELLLDELSKDGLLDQTVFTKAKDLFVDNDLVNCLEVLSRAVGRDKIVSSVTSVFSNIRMKHSEVYSYLSCWPFKFYLTTNYDSLLKEYLLQQRVSVVEKGLSKKDFITMNNAARNNIYKIHGDFSDTDSMVITGADYKRICLDPEYSYWREKIGSLFHMFTVFLVGYSANDPDFVDQLSRIKDITDPSNPAFMLVTDVSPAKIAELKKMNIRVIEYTNSDGLHSGLPKLLKLYDHFIQRRDDPLLGRDEKDSCENEIATSLYLYNNLVLKDINVINKALYNIILKIFSITEGELSIETLQNKLTSCGITCDAITLMESLQGLVDERFIIQNPTNKKFRVLDSGIDLVSETAENFNTRKEKFENYCRILLAANDNLEKEQIVKILGRLNEGLIDVFKRRGIEIANKIFNNGSISFSSSTDLLGDLNKYASSEIFSKEEYLGFVELLLEIFEHPSLEVQEYLGMLVNSYFMYQVLGQDSNARKARLEEMLNRKMIIDSSVMISSLAFGSINFEISNDLLKMLNENGIKCICTMHLLREVVEHANWAIRNFGKLRVDSLEYYSEVLGSAKRENLFINGAMKWSLGRGPVSIEEYFLEIFGTTKSHELETYILRLLMEKGISLIEINDFLDDSTETQADLEEQTQLIIGRRKTRDTYKNDLQCETEAELVLLSRIEPINFLTRSTSLIDLVDLKQLGNWLPETLFRFMGLNSTAIDLPSLYNCMLSDFSAAGFTVIEKDTLNKFTGPLFSQARLELDKQKSEFKEVLSTFITRESVEQHEQDYSLPFFTLQTAYYAAKKANDMLKIKSREADSLRKSTELSEKERTEYERLLSKKRDKQIRERNKRKKTGKHKK